MQTTIRVKLWQGTTGSEVIADLANGNWEVAEREWGGCHWQRMPVTPLIRSEILRALAASGSLL